MFLQWPLSSNVLMLTLTDSGTTAGPVHAHIQKPKNRPYLALRLYSQSVDTHACTHKGFKHLHLRLPLQTYSQICCGPCSQNHILSLMLHIWLIRYVTTSATECDARALAERSSTNNTYTVQKQIFLVDFCDSLRSSPPCADLKFQPCSQTTDYPTHFHITSFVWCVKCRRCKLSHTVVVSKQPTHINRNAFVLSKSPFSFPYNVQLSNR